MNPKCASRPNPFLTFSILAALITLLASLFPAGQTVKAFAPLGIMNATSNGDNKIFLPSVISGGSQTNPAPTPTAPAPTPTAPAPTVTPSPSASQAGFFLPYNIQGKTYATDGPSLALDANGGVHIAYTSSTSDASGNKPAFYIYCPSNCTSPASFSAPVVFNGKIDNINLSLDPQGRPRVMWSGMDPLKEKLSAYVYEACDSGCTSASNWHSARVVALDTVLAHNSRFFAIDPQGRAAMVYYIDMIGSASGTYFASCTDNCTSVAKWTSTRLTSDELEFPDLVFTKNGLPRIAASIIDLSVDPAVHYLVYLECDASCQAISEGAAFAIATCILCDIPKGYFDLVLDANDHPRMALYTGPVETGRGVTANTLYYLFCNSNCGNPSTSVWSGYSLGQPVGVGEYAHLALDSQNRPRLVYEDPSYGLEYSWCTAGCETAGPTWQTKLADSSAILDQTEPVPPLPGCQVAGWFTGKRPSIALDAAGNPRIAFDAEHWQGYSTNPPGNSGCPKIEMDEINARFTLFNQP